MPQAQQVVLDISSPAPPASARSSVTAPADTYTDPTGAVCVTSTQSAYCPGNEPATETPTPAPAPSKPPVYHALSSHRWALITKDPDAHAGETYVVYGEVTQFDTNTGPSAFRADVGAVRQYPDSIGFVDYPTNTVLDGDESARSSLVSAEAFHDLPPESFPFTIILLDSDTRRECWRAVIPGPGILRVPSRIDINEGRRVIVKIIWPDNTVSEES